jgi:C-terminal processing protease CtpA/Prc
MLPGDDSHSEQLAAFVERVERAAAAPTGPPAELLARARTLFCDLCVHLPDRRAAGIDPVADLDALARWPPKRMLDLYHQLLAVYAEFGDRHTHCLLPAPLLTALAYLPFTVAEYHENNQPCVAVVESTSVELPAGDVIVAWNGEPIEAVLDRHGAHQWGANPAARRAKALQTLTRRPLSFLPPPAGKHVTLECASGRIATLPWRVVDLARLGPGPAPGIATGDRDPHRLTVSGRQYGYLRIASFQRRPAELLADLAERARGMPERGCIIDVRGCEDGVIAAGENLLQLFTDRPLRPLSFEFRITDRIRALARTARALAAWQRPIEEAARAGRWFSASRPLTRIQHAGRVYRGPVVVLVDALTFSTAEMFAAGVQDHDIGVVIGVAPSTGGGGASAWSDALLYKLARDETLAPRIDQPRFRVAVQRCRRGPGGPLLEGHGVRPDVLHRPTRADAFAGDRQLFELASRILDSRRPRSRAWRSMT